MTVLCVAANLVDVENIQKTQLQLTLIGRSSKGEQLVHRRLDFASLFASVAVQRCRNNACANGHARRFGGRVFACSSDLDIANTLDPELSSVSYAIQPAVD